MKPNAATFGFLISVFCLFIPELLSAQRYGNIWYFGDEAGIDFNSCNPVALTNGQNPGFEGTATICDSTGQLLFYTNSDNVWNKQHLIMSNGNLVSASGSLSQVIIIRKPLSDSLYYIVTTELQASSLSLQYHIVDISLNGGLGGVISKNNVLNTGTITEQIGATRHSNGIDIWLITHEYGTNHFLSYLVTSAGISPVPVVSPCGSILIPAPSNMNARGEIKISPDGLKIAFNGNGTGNSDSSNVLQLSDFDNSSGLIFHPVSLPYLRGEFGLSFSPDNSKLYCSTWKAFNFTTNDTNFLYQFDLSSGIDSIIANSRQVIHSMPLSGPGGTFGSIKIGPDERVYVAINNSGYVGVINNPNLPGLLCNYNHNGFYLQGKTCKFGLNNYIEYTNYCTLPVASIASSDTSFCEKKCIDFFDLSLNNPTSWQWYFPGADSLSSTLQNPTGICYSNYGSYAVVLIACNASSCDTLTLSNFITINQSPSSPTILQSNDTLICTAPSSGYQWYMDTTLIIGATQSYYVPTQPGLYYVIITDTNQCNAASNSIVITGSEMPDNEKGFSIAPNPNPGSFKVELNFNSKNKNLKAQVTNVLGEIIYEKDFQKVNGKFSQRINLSAQPKGIYFLKLMSDEKVFTQKIILR
ncbi:MAG: T9SS type A sorting domain-containing protein [Bacteroidia bacterium]